MIPNANNFKFGSTAVKKLYQGSTLVWPTSTPGIDNNTIVYTTTDGNIAYPYKRNGFGQANIINNIYEGNRGVLTFDKDITTIDSSTFYYKDAFETIILPSSITSIGSGCFQQCNNLISIIIPTNANITSIEDYTFASCDNLTSVTLPSSLTSIGNRAFAGTKINSIVIPNAVTNIGEGAFFHCESLASITLPSSLTNIDDEAFYQCICLTSITIPNRVTNIGQGAFSSCVNLASVTLSNSLISIGKYAFMNCAVLQSITIPSTVTSIGTSAFYNTHSAIYDVWLSSVTVLAVVPPVAVRTFIDGEPSPWLAFTNGVINNPITIYVPTQSVNAYKIADGWSEYADKIQAIPS